MVVVVQPCKISIDIFSLLSPQSVCSPHPLSVLFQTNHSARNYDRSPQFVVADRTSTIEADERRIFSRSTIVCLIGSSYNQRQKYNPISPSPTQSLLLNSGDEYKKTTHTIILALSPACLDVSRAHTTTMIFG